jgi:hypothetical protein
MNTPEAELEKILRGAPQPPPPADLRGRLISDIKRAPASGPAPARTLRRVNGRSWLGDWWPVLAAACLTLACAVVFAVQQAEFSAETLRTSGAASESPASVPSDGAAPASQSSAPEAGAALTPDERDEIVQLRDAVARLKQEIASLEALGLENQKLRADLAAQTNAAPEFAEVAEAAARAKSIQCVNNLKQLGLAARIWAVDHGDKLPPDFLSMTNELSTAKILVCPADTAHVIANGWDSLTAANISYEYLAANGSEDEPSRVAFRCPVHGHVGLCDGSVQSEVAKRRPSALVWRDGKLYPRVRNGHECAPSFDLRFRRGFRRPPDWRGKAASATGTTSPPPREFTLHESHGRGGAAAEPVSDCQATVGGRED